MNLRTLTKRNLPLFRGRIHVLNLCSLPILALAVVRSHTETQVIVAYFIFFFCCLFNFFASSILHFKIWDVDKTSLLQRFDYAGRPRRPAGIFLMIGSSGFPSILYYMKNDLVMVIISLFHWGLIFAGRLPLCSGVFASLIFGFTRTSKWFRSLVYPFFGVPYAYLAYKLLVNGKYHSIVMTALTAIFYISGAMFYASNKPNLVPGVFEAHELFHVFCWLAFIASFMVNYHLTTGPSYL